MKFGDILWYNQIYLSLTHRNAMTQQRRCLSCIKYAKQNNRPADRNKSKIPFYLSILFFQRVLDQAISEHINLRFVCSDSTTKQQRLSMIFSVTGLLSLLWDWHQGGCKESPGELARMITPMLTVPPLMPAPGRITCDYADSPPAGSDIL